ncbi:uncharacterized protein LOC113234068 [Hyposmocoma kahamanoa]|uniref:uncharacterized protein LOC113234068 n=1 Tax=Hyposmocoma kahamanoa TaxID=1477025 RepID=UPI000E6D7627|nr:uncharacterized protein LOC113234068 [Hyposmocoma kahamanoa]
MYNEIYIYVVIMTTLQCILGLLFCILRSLGAPKECLLHMEMCVPKCPPGMVAYHTQCDKETMSQRTCDNPESTNLGITCGWSRCDCNSSLILLDDGSCGPYEKCFPRPLMFAMRGVQLWKSNVGAFGHSR